MLQVGIHDDGGPPGDAVQPRGHGGFLAEVSCKTHAFDADISLAEPLDDGETLVAAAVIDENQLPGELERFEHGLEPFVQNR